MFQSLCLVIQVLGITWMVVVGLCTPVVGQVSTAPAARNPWDGLLQNLVDSQMSVNTTADPRAAAPIDPARLSSQEFRSAVNNFSAEASQLISGLQFETRYDTNARALLGDAIRLKSTVDVLQRRLQTPGSTTQIADDIATLDGQWRNLSHAIKQYAGVSTSILRRVETMDQLRKTIAGSLQVSPQVDRTELLNAFAALAAGLGQLAEDIELDLYTHPQRQNWSRGARDLRSRADQLRMAVSNNYAHRDIVSYYKQFFDAWTSMKRDLREVDNRYVQRNVNRLTQVNERLHTLLWLPPVIDGRDILYLAETLYRQAETVSERITLRQLVALNNATEVFRRAREFFALSDEFRKTVARETNLENIRWDFRVLDTAWFDLRAVLGPMEDPRNVQYLALLDGTITELRTGLGLQSTFDRSQTEQLASGLGNMADLLAYDMQRYIGKSTRYSPQVRDEALSAAENLRRQSRELQQAVAQNASANVLKTQFRAIDQEWQRLQRVLTQLTVEDRSLIARSYQDIAPTLTKLQVLYSL